MSDKNNKFFDKDRFCEVYTGTVRKVHKQALPDWSSQMPARAIFIEPFDKKTKWLVISGFLMDIPEGTRLEICCFNGSLQLAYHRSKNYVITNGQILNIEILNKPKEVFSEMTKEEALENYIKNMGAGRYGYSKERIAQYISSAKQGLTNLRANKLFDPERYNALETERAGIYSKFLGNTDEGENLGDIINTLYARFEEIGDELTTLWEQDEDLASAFDFSLV